jgi:predicted amidohydrolase/GNAT superfamily N-acetyltransferase
MPIDTAPYERRIQVRLARSSDAGGIVGLMQACYPYVDPRMEERVRAQLAMFPEGQFVAVLQKKVVGYAASMRLDLDEHPGDHTWKELTDDGFLTDHDPEGPDLYGVDMMVHPDCRRMRIGHRLYAARRDLARQLNLRRIAFAGRMPGLQKQPEITPERYVELVHAERLRDPTLTFQFRQGFHPMRVLHGYLPWDKESLGHGLLMEWTNLEYQPPGGRKQKAVQALRVCIIQYGMGRVPSWDGFVERCREFVSVASDYEADFVIFPELFTLQNASHMDAKTGVMMVRGQAERTEQYITAFRDFATSYNVNIVAGSQPVVDGEAIFNVAFLFHRDGRIDRQAKLHITPGEKQEAGFVGGAKIEVFDTDRGRIAIPVCYDIEFPEAARLAVDMGARVLFVPYSTRDRQGHLRVTRCAQARAIENQVFVVTAGTVGTQPSPTGMDIHYAQSGVFTPSDFGFARDGVQAECSVNAEMVLVADLDLEELRWSRREGTVRPAQDRRHDLYRLQPLWEGAEAPRAKPGSNHKSTAKDHAKSAGSAKSATTTVKDATSATKSARRP